MASSILARGLEINMKSTTELHVGLNKFYIKLCQHEVHFLDASS